MPNMKKSRMYTQEEYDGAMNRVTVPQARKKMSGYHNMSNADYNLHMGTYKAAAGAKPQKVSGGKIVTKPGKIGPRKGTKKGRSKPKGAMRY